MERIIIFFVALLFCGCGGAKSVSRSDVERRQPDMAAWSELLGAAGYKLYSFNLSGLEVRGVEVREYRHGKETARYPGGDFPESHVKRLDIGFWPSGCDSMMRVQVSVNGGRGLIPISLGLKRLDTPETDRIYYQTRPYVHTGKVGKGFLPLAMLGSGWWDAGSRMIRFCGVTELGADDTSGFNAELLGNMPHCYIIGADVK